MENSTTGGCFGVPQSRSEYILATEASGLCLRVTTISAKDFPVPAIVTSPQQNSMEGKKR
jgi:hypothetical protein